MDAAGETYHCGVRSVSEIIKAWQAITWRACSSTHPIMACKGLGDSGA